MNNREGNEKRQRTQRLYGFLSLIVRYVFFKLCVNTSLYFPVKYYQSLTAATCLTELSIHRLFFFPHHLEFWSFFMCFGALKSLHEINYVTLSLSTFKYSI